LLTAAVCNARERAGHPLVVPKPFDLGVIAHVLAELRPGDPAALKFGLRLVERCRFPAGISGARSRDDLSGRLGAYARRDVSAPRTKYPFVRTNRAARGTLRCTWRQDCTWRDTSPFGRSTISRAPQEEPALQARGPAQPS
jgi:hypothetical protein